MRLKIEDDSKNIKNYINAEFYKAYQNVSSKMRFDVLQQIPFDVARDARLWGSCLYDTLMGPESK